MNACERNIKRSEPLPSVSTRLMSGSFILNVHDKKNPRKRKNAFTMVIEIVVIISRLRTFSLMKKFIPTMTRTYSNSTGGGGGGGGYRSTGGASQTRGTGGFGQRGFSSGGGSGGSRFGGGGGKPGGMRSGSGGGPMSNGRSSGGSFHPYQRPQNNSNNAGSNLRKPNWDSEQLRPFKKDFYVPHPTVSGRHLREVSEFRELHKITLKGDIIPNPIQYFEEGNFPDYVLQGMSSFFIMLFKLISKKQNSCD